MDLEACFIYRVGILILSQCEEHLKLFHVLSFLLDAVGTRTLRILHILKIVHKE